MGFRCDTVVRLDSPFGIEARFGGPLLCRKGMYSRFMARLANSKYGPSKAVAAGGSNAYALLTTALAGANNDITYTANQRGTNGNSVRVRYVVSGVTTPLSVVVAGNDITVNVETMASAGVSTATQVIAAVTASVPATALVSAANATSNTGAGVVAALAYTNLAGGVQQTVGRAQGTSRQAARGLRA